MSCRLHRIRRNHPRGRSNPWAMASRMASALMVITLWLLAGGAAARAADVADEAGAADVVGAVEAANAAAVVAAIASADADSTASGPSAAEELERLRQLARERSSEELASKEEPETFVARGLGLQELNPEISVTGDFLAGTQSLEGERSSVRSDFRGLGIHVESYLDPYSRMKAAFSGSKAGFGLGEAYFTRFGMLPDVNLTLGKFRQQFGVVNRWHKHALDQVDFPLPLRSIFGPAGLNQTGLSLDVRLPQLGGSTQSGILQITAGENDRLFGQNPRRLPSVLARLESYRDLSPSTYLDLGVTGLLGFNDEWAVGDASVHDSRATWVAGADLTLRWEPTDNMRYAHLEWRTEYYHVQRRIVAPDGSGRDEVEAWGVYTSMQRQVSRTVELGVRGDLFRPDTRSYAAPFLGPLITGEDDAHRWQVGPYLTWWQSPFVKARLEIDYADGSQDEASDLAVTLQVVFAAGPHKHERY